MLTGATAGIMVLNGQVTTTVWIARVFISFKCEHGSRSLMPKSIRFKVLLRMSNSLNFNNKWL